MNQTGASWRGNSDDEDDLDVREPWMWGGKKAYIFLIDVTERMFETDVQDESFFLTAIQACKTILLKDIVNGTKNLYAIVLYGTKQKGKASQANHITTLQNLSCPNADQVKDLMNIISDVDGFEREHGHSNDFSLAEALWHCLKIVSNCTTKIHEKTILLMTCNDNPHASDPKLQHDTRTRANDLHQVLMQLKVLPFGISFNADLFFKEVVKTSRGDDDLDVTDLMIVKTIDDVVSRIEGMVSKRSSSRVLWTLGKDVQLGVAAYSFFKATDPFPKKIRITRSKNSIVTSRAQAFNSTTGEEVSTAEVSKAIPIGGKIVTFEKEELQTMRFISQPGLVLLGFKPTHTIKLWYQIKSSLFLYPEERLVKGSRTLFAALHERCLARNVTPICFFTARRGGRPKLVALWPQQEKLDKNNSQIVPPGFILRYLPYADNVRDLSEQEVKCPDPEPELVTLAEKIIQKTKFKFNPRNIDNPKLQTQWAGIEALALGYENPEPVDDLTLPDHDVMDGRMADLATAFMEMAFPDGFSEDVVSKAAKRSAPSKPPAPKKIKPDLENMDLEDMARQGLVEKLKVDQLKSYLGEWGIKTTRMKKAELVEAVYNHLGIPDPTM
ncbi:X-ray repair cross-complementing protein 6 [Thrips palmi]|uniref:ATP-dependent DNA helicase 2 subunit 1 n=1 Tax=Thrips palmi TaxID=161013 RepID=A0A6P9ANE0_THRPL|nr:X-ray repair cross-complementing protein 6 [Thrips palmi]XP_034257117.1 X-ray repair cross-complementing protein 6 [Thrips palmi]